MFGMYACEMTHQVEDETGIILCSLCSIVVGLLLATVRRRRLLLEIHDDGDTVPDANGTSREQQLWQPPPQGRGREQRRRWLPSLLALFFFWRSSQVAHSIRHSPHQSAQSVEPVFKSSAVE